MKRAARHAAERARTHRTRLYFFTRFTLESVRHRLQKEVTLDTGK